MTNTDATVAVNEEMGSRNDMIISDGVDKWYGDFQALKSVSATLKEREVVVTWDCEIEYQGACQKKDTVV